MIRDFTTTSWKAGDRLSNAAFELNGRNVILTGVSELCLIRPRLIQIYWTDTDQYIFLKPANKPILNPMRVTRERLLEEVVG